MMDISNGTGVGNTFAPLDSTLLLFCCLNSQQFAPEPLAMKRYEMSPQPAKTVAHLPPILLASGRLLAPFRIFPVSIHAKSDLAASPTRPSRSPRCLRRVSLRICLELYPQPSSIDNATTSRAAITRNDRANSSRPSSTSPELRCA